MPFKIVQTIEDGETCLSIIPSNWEEGGILKWPTKPRLAQKLSFQENSIPESDWDTMLCLKKREFKLRQEAEKELTKMELHSDTEKEEDSSLPKQKKKRTFKQINDLSSNNDYDFNNLVPEEIKVKESGSSASNSNNIIILQNDLLVPSQEKENSKPVDENNTGSLFLENSFLNYCHNDSVKLDLILENQTKIFGEIAKLQTSFDYIANILLKQDKIKERPSTSSTLRTPMIKPIKSYEDFKQFEENLKDQEYFKEVVQSMSLICGCSGREKGLDCSYRLIDYFLDRQMLTQCSWTGSGKKKEEKVPFKFFEYFRKCFFDIIFLADKNFTVAECDIFFKRILKNSIQRCNSKSGILCKHKKRPSNLNYKKSSSKDEEEILEKVNKNGEENNNHEADISDNEGPSD